MTENIPDTPQEEKPKWYFSTSTLVVGFLIIGPFVLPLVWLNPRLSQAKKIVLTVIIVTISAMLYSITKRSFETLGDYNDLLQGTY